MEQNTTLQELEEMKTQINLLKSKLDSQNIINDRLLRQSMKGKVDTINRNAIFAVIACIVAITLASSIFMRMGLSKSLIIATIVMMVFCAVMTIFHHRKMWRKDFTSKGLVYATEELIKLKKHYTGWLRIALPMLAVWFIWLVIECFMKFGTPQALPFVTGTVAGLLVGGLLGNRQRLQVVRKMDELLADIEELRSEEDRTL